MQINQGNPCLANRQVQTLFHLGITTLTGFASLFLEKKPVNLVNPVEV
ncbi:MAG: hypothetical protein KF734_16415 [Saprospiraceae bacterium]|nr:hypothetical protein [Saprospiraceae bacterium]